VRRAAETFALILVIGLLALPAPASAGDAALTVTQSGDTTTLTGSGLAEQVSVRQESGEWVFTDSLGLTSGGGCDQLDATTVSCSPTAFIVLILGGGADTVDAENTSAVVKVTIHGGAEGDVVVLAGNGAFVVYGDAGADTISGIATTGPVTLVGGAGVDAITGGSSADTIDARDGGKDTVNCGAGADVAFVDLVDVVGDCDRVHFYPRVTSPVVRKWRLVGPTTKVVTLTVAKVPARGKVVVKCSRNTSCPFSSRTARIIDRKAKLAGYFEDRRLRAGAVVEVRVTAPGKVGKVVRFTIRKQKLPAVRTLCLVPGADRPSAC
jgi:hypothetical protein